MSDPHTEAILPFRRRPDLVVARQGNSWTLKDPLTLKYFSLQQAEYFVWSRLNGRITLQDVIQEFERLYTPQRLTAETVTSFLVQLWRQGLLLLDQPGQSVDLAMRARIVRSARRGQSIQNLLAIRFRGIDPDRFLARIMPFVGWLVSWPVALLGLVFVLFAVSIILGDWDRFMRELPSIQTFLQADRILWLAATLACVKGIHELGHAITCKRFGGECRELGVMLLAFTPCLYCNVSDAWLLADRRHRVLISAAGIMVELFLAAMAVFVWVSTVPGIVHSLAMYVILICSLNTVLLNGNPLLRYDGYYVLSDAIGVPNLRERSQQIFRGALAQWTLGVRDISPRRITAGRLGLGLYGAASSIYVWVVIAGILWLFYRLARPHDLQGLVILLAITVVGSRLWSGGRRMSKWIQRTGQRSDVSRGRMALGLAVIVAFFGTVLFVPWGGRVRGPAFVRGGRERVLFVSKPGRIAQAETDGMSSSVDAGEPLVQLVNPEIDLELVRRRTERDRLAVRTEMLERRSFDDPMAAVRIPTAKAAHEEAEQHFAGYQADAARLSVTAPFQGLLLPSASAAVETVDEGPAMINPLEPRSQGVWLKVGTPLGTVADARTWSIILYLPQSDVRRVRVDQPVRLCVEQWPGRVLVGRVKEIATDPVEELPEVVAAAGVIPIDAAEGASRRPAVATHEVRVELDQPPAGGLLHQIGSGTIETEAESLATWMAREVSRTFALSR